MSWTATTLEECAEFRSGGTPSKSVASNWRGDIPWVSAKDLGPFRLVDSEDHITETAVRAGVRTAPEGSTLILVRGMTLHRDVPMAHCGREVAFNQDIKALLPRPGVLPLYLSYALLAQRDSLRGLVDSASHGTGRIKTELLERLPISLPSLPEQDRIASVLGSLDTKIELNRKMIQTLEEIARTLYRGWFVNFEWETDLVNSDLGLIPKGWRVGQLDEIATLVKETVKPAEEPECEWLHFSIPAYDDARRPVAEPGREIKSNKYRVPESAVLVSKLNPRLPRVWRVQGLEHPRAACSTELLPFVPRQREWLPYLYELLRSKLVRGEIRGRATGTTGSRQRVKPRDIAHLPVLRPRDETFLTEFSEHIGALHERVELNRRENETLTELRDTLLPKLISGEIRVPEAAELAEDAGASPP